MLHFYFRYITDIREHSIDRIEKSSLTGLLFSCFV